MRAITAPFLGRAEAAAGARAARLAGAAWAVCGAWAVCAACAAFGADAVAACGTTSREDPQQRARPAAVRDVRASVVHLQTKGRPDGAAREKGRHVCRPLPPGGSSRPGPGRA